MPPVAAMTGEDPFDAVLRPPVGETEDEKRERLAREAEATQISQAIDESIRQERQKQKKTKIVRVLLIGQSESGELYTPHINVSMVLNIHRQKHGIKTCVAPSITRVKNRCLTILFTEFQRLYTPTAFREERAIWRSVIQLNLVRSIRTIMDAVIHALHERAIRVDSGEETDSDYEEALGPLDDVRNITARLAPVRSVEATLIHKLVPRDEEEPTRLTAAEEVFVRPGVSWKGHLSAARSIKGKAPVRTSSSRPTSPGSSTLVDGVSDEDINMALHACRLDMLALWNHSSTRAILRRRKLRLEESPGL
jgi:hypothetical protein